MTRKSHSSRNTYWMALLFFLFFKFIGLATLSMNSQSTLKKKGPRNVVSFTANKLGVLYNLLFSCLMIASNYISIPILYDAEYEHRTILTTIIEIFQGVLGSIVVSLILLHYCVYQSVLIKISNYMIQIESSLRRLHQPLNWKHIISGQLIIYTFKLNLCIAVVVTDYMSFHTNPCSWLANVLPATFVGFVFIQYFSALSLTDAIFVNINTFARNLCRSWSNDIRPNSLFETRRVFISCSSVQFLVQIRDMHDHLCDIANEMSEFYSSPILIGTTFIFFTLLYNTYYLFKPLMVDNVPLQVTILTNTLLWIIFLLYPLGLLTTKVTKLIKEIEKTGNIVHALLNRTIDPEARAELKQFSLQLLHRKMNFTANGYFALDNTLFQSVLSTVTTYMVILVQFQMGTSNQSIDHRNCTR